MKEQIRKCYESSKMFVVRGFVPVVLAALLIIALFDIYDRRRAVEQINRHSQNILQDHNKEVALLHLAQSRLLVILISAKVEDRGFTPAEITEIQTLWKSAKLDAANQPITAEMLSSQK